MNVPPDDAEDDRDADLDTTAPAPSPATESGRSVDPNGTRAKEAAATPNVAHVA